MLFSTSWWDSGGSEAVFLLLGSAMTLSTTLLIERRRDRKDDRRRKQDWQRSVVTELQDLAFSHSQTVTRVVLGYLRAVTDNKDAGLGRVESLAAPEDIQALRVMGQNLQVLAGRSLDTEVQAATSAYVSATDKLLSLRGDTASMLADVEALGLLLDLHRELARLLARTFG